MSMPTDILLDLVTTVYVCFTVSLGATSFNCYAWYVFGLRAVHKEKKLSKRPALDAMISAS